MAHDYGIDLQLFTFNGAGEYQEGDVLLQLKASDRLRVRKGRKTIALRIDRRDLVCWLRQMMLVILILYDAQRDVAFWVYVQSYFHRLEGFNIFAAGQTITLRFPVANVLSPAAIRRFARFRDRIAAQTSEVIHDEDATDFLS